MGKTERPGTMIYFDDIRALKMLGESAVGQMIIALQEYAEFGVVPEFEDVSLKMMWETIRPKVDRDGDKYQNTVIQRKYAAYCKEQRKNNMEMLPFDDWAEQVL